MTPRVRGGKGVRTVLAATRRWGCPIAAVLLVGGAVLAFAVGPRAGLAAGCAGAAVLAAAQWMTARALTAAARRHSNALAVLASPPPGNDVTVLARIDALDARLRDLPLMAEQSVVVTGSLHRFEESLAQLGSELAALRAERPLGRPAPDRELRTGPAA